MSEAIEVKCEKGILWVTINRPKANAIDAATSRQLNAVFDAFEQNDDARVAILTGAGERFFSAGWDLKAAADGETADADYGHYGFGGLVTRFERQKPVIAAVNGLAIGGGFEMALCCDLIVASKHAQFALPETRVGVVPDTAALRLIHRMPYFKAMEMLLTGNMIGAKKAKKWGLVNEICKPDRLHHQAEALAQSIIAGAPLAVAAIKSLVNASEQSSLQSCHQKLATRQFEAYEKMLRSGDAREGAKAFAEKREPRWQGE